MQHVPRDWPFEVWIQQKEKMIDEKDVLSFLRCSASAPVQLALEMVNLTDNERIAVDLCGVRGLTYEKAAEELQKGEASSRREVDTIKRWYKSARKKLLRAWSGVYWVEAIVRYERDSS